MYGVPVKTLLEAGVHFGHRASRWNPKMEPFIFGKRNLIHIIDLKETLRGLIKASSVLQGLATRGQQILFVGTKRQAQNLIMTEASRVGMPFVVERWLGGTLTNNATVRSRLHRLEELETMVADGTMSKLTKKQVSILMREKRKIYRNLNGIRGMSKMPGAMVIIDPRKEKTAVREARKMGIPTIAILDTDCDPTDIDIAIPGNDDALRSLQVLVSKLVEAIELGLQSHQQYIAEEEKRKSDEASRADVARKAKADEQKKRQAQQDELEKILKKAREERATRLADEEAQKAREESATPATDEAPAVAAEPVAEDTPAPEAPDAPEGEDTKPGPFGPETTEG